MGLDIDNGVYNASSYPPFFSNTTKRDENISPFDTSAPNNDLTHWKVISAPQRDRYYDLIETSLKTNLDTNKSTDPEVAILFAHYRIDYHIQQHYLTKRGVLSLCRDASDMHALRKWQWRISEIDAVMGTDETRPWPLGCRKLGWVNDENLVMVHATLLWKRSWRARQKHLEEVRVRWAAIMAERKRQRELLLAKQAAETFTVRVYCKGELCDVRELKRMAYSEPGFRAKRATQSFGV